MWITARKQLTFLTMLLLAATASQAGAGDNPNGRQRNQEDRIKNGIHSGQLTSKEADELKKKEARIKDLEHKLRADGKLSAGERAKMKKELDDLGSQIRGQKHDKQKV
jgi:Spy/CpxP family protein refolding chaperone